MPPSRRTPWLRRQQDFFASGRLSVWLLAILALVLSVHLFLPQEGEVGTEALRRWAEQRGLTGRLCRALGLNDVLHSWLFWGPYALLLVNLLLCMIQRLRAGLPLSRFPEQPPRPASSWLRREVEAGGLGAERVGELLRRRGYRTLIAGETVYALRGRFAIVGHWLFHLGLLALLLAGIFVATAAEPFRGTVGVGEGEPFDLHRAPFLSSTRPPSPDLPPLRFQMERIEVQTEGSAVRRFDARLSTPEGGRATIGINRPYRRTPYQVVVHGFGYMAGWVIVDEQGRMLRGAWVKLVPFPLERADSFPLGPKWSRVHVHLYPDYERQGEEDRSRSQELGNARFEVRIVWRGEEIYEGLLEPEQRVQLEDGKDFFFLPEIRRYGMLDVIQERGQTIVFACLGIMILGLAIRYVRIRKEILVQRAGGALRVFGRAEIFESLFAEEFGHLTSALASATPRPESRPEDRRGVS
jgi:hypothetical protein